MFDYEWINLEIVIMKGYFAYPFVKFEPLGAKMNPLYGFNGFKCTHQNQSSNTPYFDYVSTTNECIDLPYFATICQDMY